MHNYTYIVYDPIKDAKLEAELRTAGFTVQRDGRFVRVIGSTEEYWNRVRKEADGFWGH